MREIVGLGGGEGGSGGQKPVARSGVAATRALTATAMERLGQEQENFEDFLDSLRAAKDSTEFDQFMDDRAGRLTAPS